MGWCLTQTWQSVAHAMLWSSCDKISKIKTLQMAKKNNLEDNVITKRHVGLGYLWRNSSRMSFSFCEHKNAGIISKHSIIIHKVHK